MFDILLPTSYSSPTGRGAEARSLGVQVQQPSQSCKCTLCAVTTEDVCYLHSLVIQELAWSHASNWMERDRPSFSKLFQQQQRPEYQAGSWGLPLPQATRRGGWRQSKHQVRREGALPTHAWGHYLNTASPSPVLSVSHLSLPLNPLQDLKMR